MPDPAYRVARQVARQVSAELELTPPFDVERIVGRFAQVVDEEIPTHADVIVLHAAAPGDRPRVVLDASLKRGGERRRFALAHGLGHVLLGWHPLGTPCDVSLRPQTMPVTAHDLVEGESNAFARELLLPAAWIASFDAFDRPAQLIRHVAERGGLSAMPAARSVSSQLPASFVWAVTDQWGRVLDAGRSPGTTIRPPRTGDELDAGAWSRHSAERHRDELDGCVISVWRFDLDPHPALAHDRSARAVAADIADDLGLAADGSTALMARVEGLAGWANEQPGTASLEGMQRVLDERARTVPELANVASHPEYAALLTAKATELVAKRLAR